MTRWLAWISPGAPSAIFCPKFRTAIRSATPITRSIVCSMRKIVALELERLTQDIRRLRELGATIFLIEHTMDLVMGVADRIAVLNFGQKIAEGAPGEIQANQRVIEAYLGREASRA